MSQWVNGAGDEGPLEPQGARDGRGVTGRTVPLDPKTLGMTLREPYGVIAAIVPFNMPVAMLSNKVACALAAGNTVVAKPPEQARVGVLRFAELAQRGAPPGHGQHRRRPRRRRRRAWCATSTSPRSR